MDQALWQSIIELPEDIRLLVYKKFMQLDRSSVDIRVATQRPGRLQLQFDPWRSMRMHCYMLDMHFICTRSFVCHRSQKLDYDSDDGHRCGRGWYAVAPERVVTYKFPEYGKVQMKVKLCYNGRRRWQRQSMTIERFSWSLE